LKIEDLKAFELLEEKSLDDVHATGYRFLHKKSKAKISIISNDDENKVFYIGFRTPPADSTGVAHIIEHSVLCGSKKFPVKDPFVELVKGSLNTFLNAITYSDKTVYPVASCNDKDFQNLMDVYLDAVFHPNIYEKEEIFKQEGWHYELNDKQEPITINGVVYNEMKGAFSSPEGVLDRMILNSLFPDNAYKNESGGDPQCIPDLTYDNFLKFHQTYYHPSNSYIYLYGNMDIAEKLDYLDRAYLSEYEAFDVDSEIKLQKPFEKPKEMLEKYSIASNESMVDNTYLSYNMVIATSLDKELYLAFDVLDYALLNAPGAPIKKALLDAGIGKDIMGSYDASTYQPIFSVVSKNANLAEKEKFVETIRTVLKDQVKNKINRKSLLAGINSAEFKYREADFGQFPKGLIYGLQCFDSWLYDENKPFLHLEALDTFKFLKEQIDTGYFEKLIETYMLNNHHVSIVVIEPQRGLSVEKDKKLEEKLEDYKNALSEVELETLIHGTKALRMYQEEPSAKEDMDKIPMLERSDMKKKATPFINEEICCEDTLILHHDVFTNGIYYLGMLFDITDFSEEEVVYLGMLKAVLGYMDTNTYAYSDLANEINLYTGGISSSLSIYPNIKETDKYQIKYEIHTKMLYENLDRTLALIQGILQSTKVEDEKRLHEILSQIKSRLQMSLSSAGHSTSATRAMSGFSVVSKFNDLTGGIALYRVVASYEEHFNEKKEELTGTLKKLIKKIFTKQNLMVNLTSDRDGLLVFEEKLSSFRQSLYENQTSNQKAQTRKFSLEKKKEGFLDASLVQYVSRAGNFVKEGYSYTGLLKILKVILSYDYLWINVRVKGGAYGCMSGFSRIGDTYFTSYRDPNLSETNDIYNKIPEYLRNFKADEHEMTKYIIGTMSDMDIPLNPLAKGLRSMTAYLNKITFEDVQKERDEVLNATEADIIQLSGLIKAVLAQEYFCVIGNEDVVKENKGMFDTLENLF